MRRVTNWVALYKSLLLLAFAGLILSLALTGKIRFFIHPRFAPFTAAAAVCLALMALVQLRRFRSPVQGSSGGGSLGPYLIFLVPLALALFVPTTTLGADLAAKQGVNFTARSSSAPKSPSPAVAAQLTAAEPPASPGGTGQGTESLASAPKASSPPTPAISAPPTLASPIPAPSDLVPSSPVSYGTYHPQVQAQDQPQVQPSVPLPVPLPDAPPGQAPPDTQPKVTFKRPPVPGLENGRVVLNEKTFAGWLLEIYDFPEKYLGQSVTITGFAFRPDGLEADEVTLVRLIVTCHVAHAAPDGFILRWPEAGSLKTDSWYRVEGIFEKGLFDGRETIRIRVKSVTPVDKPADPYIYQ